MLSSAPPKDGTLAMLQLHRDVEGLGRLPGECACVLQGVKLATSPGFRGGARVTGSTPSGSVGPVECEEQPRANGCHQESWE